MVRYGKLPFRALVAQYETHLVWTPMMLCVLLPLVRSPPLEADPALLHSAAEFSRSAIARDSDFSTSTTERGTFIVPEAHAASPVAEWDPSPEPSRGIHAYSKRMRKVKGRLLLQFAANDPVQLAEAAELAKPYVDGIDLNCGASALSLLEPALGFFSS